jgi:hypothetical protein
MAVHSIRVWNRCRIVKLQSDPEDTRQSRAGRARAGEVKAAASRAIAQASLYLHEGDVVGAVALIYAVSAKEYEVTHAAGPLSDRLPIVAPRSDEASSS